MLKTPVTWLITGNDKLPNKLLSFFQSKTEMAMPNDKLLSSKLIRRGAPMMTIPPTIPRKWRESTITNILINKKNHQRTNLDFAFRKTAENFNKWVKK